MKNRYIPRYLFKRPYLFSTVLFVLAFSILFMNVFAPLSSLAWFSLRDMRTFVLTVLFFLVATFFLLISKQMLVHISKRHRFTYIYYILWHVGELLAIAFLYAVITTVFVFTDQHIFGEIFLKASMCVFVVLAIPYCIALMYGVYNHQRKILKQLGYRSVVSNEVSDGVQYINLADNNGNLKLTLSSDALYYLESQDNYVNVFYESNGRICHYMLRCKIKTIEENFGGRLLRCHRSYVVNRSKIKLFKNERKGMYLELKHDGIKPIPVSKTYQEAVVKTVSELE